MAAVIVTGVLLIAAAVLLIVAYRTKKSKNAPSDGNDQLDTDARV